MAGGVLGIEGTRTVQADPRGAVAAARGGDVDACLVGAQEAPVRGGGPVAEDRAGPAGEHCGQPAPLDAQRGVPEGIDTVMDAV